MIPMNDKQSLTYYADTWRVWSPKKNHIKCKLVPVKAKDRKVGYTYYRASCDFESGYENFSKLENYCKYLGNNEFVYIDEKNVNVSINMSWNYWYQVVPLEE